MISARECFHGATLELVRATPIKQRLVCAYRRYLAAVKADQLPGDVQESFGQVLRFLQCVPPLRGEDAVAASVRKMSNQDADECAAIIVDIFSCLNFANASSRAKTVVQLHSVDFGGDDYEVAALIANR